MAKQTPRPASRRGKWTRDDYREALIRVVERQLACARAGIIGTPAWELAFKEQLYCANRFYAKEAGLRSPLPWVYSEDHDRFQLWVVPEGKPMPGWGGPTGHANYDFEVDHPEALKAVNLLAVHTLNDWLLLVRSPRGSQRPIVASDRYEPANWFAPAKIKASTLRGWLKKKEIPVRKIQRVNHYLVERAFQLAGVAPHIGEVACDNAVRKRMGVD
jgi:hypothetical protein